MDDKSNAEYSEEEEEEEKELEKKKNASSSAEDSNCSSLVGITEDEYSEKEEEEREESPYINFMTDNIGLKVENQHLERVVEGMTRD